VGGGVVGGWLGGWVLRRLRCHNQVASSTSLILVFCIFVCAAIIKLLLRLLAAIINNQGMS
jgi:uncharacterized membrane protein YeaQ/YmgE (transglycosylase-associated protein family)